MRNILATFKSVTAGSMSTQVISEITDIRWLDNMVMYIAWTGAAYGTFFVDTSPDKLNWYPLNLDPVPVASGMAGNHRIDMNQLPDAYIRTRYVPSAGTGTLNVSIAGKLL